MKYTDPPFELGETLQGKDDAGNYVNGEVLGKVFEFPANRLSVSQIRGQKGRKTGKAIVAVALRNVSGVKLYGKYLASLVKTAPTDFATSGYNQPLIEAVDGYALTLSQQNVVVIDEFLATTGVADDDIFWGIIGGPVTLKTPIAGAGANIAIGSKLCVDASGSTSGVTTSGRVEVFPSTSSLAVWDGHIGYALEAKTTAETNEDILIEACIKF